MNLPCSATGAECLNQQRRPALHISDRQCSGITQHSSPHLAPLVHLERKSVMKKTHTFAIICVLCLVAPSLTVAQGDAVKPQYFNQKVADSNPLRTERRENWTSTFRRLPPTRRDSVGSFSRITHRRRRLRNLPSHFARPFARASVIRRRANGPQSRRRCSRSVRTRSGLTTERCFPSCREFTPKGFTSSRNH